MPLMSPPKWIVFYAHRSVETGSMRLLDGRVVFEALQDSAWRDVVHQDLVYCKCMPSNRRIGFGKTWQEHFEESDSNSVTTYLESRGVSYRWLPNGDLRVHYRTPFIRRHPAGQVWFAQPRLWHLPFRGVDWFERSSQPQHAPTVVQLGSGAPFPVAFLHWLEQCEQEFAYRLQLEDGGLLLVDNHRIAHGREPYVGDREHWVTMGT